MKTYRAIFCWLYTHWLSRITEKGDVLVRVLDATIGSHCKYCMSARGILLGLGLGLLSAWDIWRIIAGVTLIAAVAAMTIGERSGWCELPDEAPNETDQRQK